MTRKHISFIVEQAYGHIVPTLGIAMELIRRGHRVSYATSENFIPLVARSGATVFQINPMKTRAAIFNVLFKKTSADGFEDTDINPEVIQRYREIITRRTHHTLPQLERCYETERPDLIIHDDGEDFAGRLLAERWGVAKIRLSFLQISDRDLPAYANDRSVIIPMPRFFNDDLRSEDEKLHFVGFTPEGRVNPACRWKNPRPSNKIILANPTSGIFSQTHFCSLVIDAFKNSRYNVVLSVPSVDPWSAIDVPSLGKLPDNFHVNTSAAHIEILRDCQLFVGQGGPGSTLEALYCGVPLLLLPPASGHELSAKRIVDLGLGRRLDLSKVSPAELNEAAESVMSDRVIRTRLHARQEEMMANPGGARAADLVELELR